jgi:uncharacterized membrane protein HdeD (DUF308 family)
VTNLEPTPDDVRAAARLWWVAVALGALSIVAGAIVLAKPSNSLRVLAVVAGILILLDGVVQLVAAFTGDRANRGLLGLIGTLNLLIGILLIRHPVSGVQVIALIIGLWLVAAGAIRLVIAFSNTGNRLGGIIVGLLEAIFGIVIVSSPKIGFATLAVLVGISFIANGVGMIVFGILLRTLKSERRRGGVAVTT